MTSHHHGDRIQRHDGRIGVIVESTKQRVVADMGSTGLVSPSRLREALHAARPVVDMTDSEANRWAQALRDEAASDPDETCRLWDSAVWELKHGPCPWEKL